MHDFALGDVGALILVDMEMLYGEAGSIREAVVLPIERAAIQRRRASDNGKGGALERSWIHRGSL